MAGARERRLAPAGQPRLARLGIDLRRGLVEPGVEGGGGAPVAVEEMLEIVIAHAAADDHDALIAQRRQRLADRDVARGIEAALDRDHDDGNLGLRIDDQHRHEHAVVEAAAVVLADGEARRLDEALDFGGNLRRPRRGVVEFIGVRRKAVIVEQHPRRGGDANRRARLFPMRGDDDERLRPLRQAGDDPREIVPERVPGVGRERRARLDPETRPAAVREENRRLANVGHARLGVLWTWGTTESQLCRRSTQIHGPGKD